MASAGLGDEQDLARRLRRGDPDALAIFSDAFLHRVYAFVFYRVAGDQQTAEDITQESFLSAIAALERFDGRSALFTWLCSIARHKLADHYRRHYRLEQAQAALEEPLDPELDPADWMEREERRRQILGVLRSQPARYQQVLALKYLDRLSGKELARTLGLSEDAAESLLTRARAAFRRAFRANERWALESETPDPADTGRRSTHEQR